MSDHTPTTDDIEYSYVEGPWGEGGKPAFDRWLTKERLIAKADGYDEGFDAGYADQQYKDTSKAMPQNPYRSESGMKVIDPHAINPYLGKERTDQ